MLFISYDRALNNDRDISSTARVSIRPQVSRRRALQLFIDHVEIIENQAVPHVQNTCLDLYEGTARPLKRS